MDILEWDSTFFGFKIGRIVLDKELDVQNSLFELEKKESVLTYVFSREPVEKSMLRRYNGELADTKVWFTKTILDVDANFSDKSIVEDAKYLDKEKIYKLAYLSGNYSRFKLDSNIPRKKFEQMYKLWVDNSLSGNLASKVFVYLLSNEIVGFVTLAVKDGFGEIGLIAVAAEAQGKSIGSKLIHRVEVFLKQNGIEELRVPTQKENRQAMQFYKKNNFLVLEEILIYHFWNK